jgi:predicted aspartyl protease
MPQFLQPRIALVCLSALLTVISAGCSSINAFSNTTPDVTGAVVPISPSPAASVPAAVASPRAAAPAPKPAAQPDNYQRAIARASSAVNISQSAQSQDDWRLVASRWQQAIQLMSSVPGSSPNHTQAQTKLRDYRRNLTYAQQQVNRPRDNSNPGSVIVIAPSRIASTAPTNVIAPLQNGGVEGGVFNVPIIRRVGGTPVVNVTFNGNQSFEMIVDTGASGTLITRQMAASLRIVPVGEARVDTASARDVSFPLGYVNSIQVGGAVARNIVVAVAGPELGIGLLGHDFFGDYDVTIRQNEVEFRVRS